MASGSKTAIYAAILGNFAVAVTKFIAAGITGSAAMLSEGIHSLVDTSNGALLLVGIHRSRRPADASHPFGHGKDLYFYTLMVAVLIFAVGGGISIYEGVNHVLHAEESGDPTVNYIVIGLAIIFESIAWALALKGFLQLKGDVGMWRSVRESKDPTTFAVLFEDSAALGGLIIAGVGIFLAHELGIPELDGAASILIGILLCAVAVVLLKESKGLLLGESALPDVVNGIERIAVDDPSVIRAGRVLTMHIGPHEVLVNLDLQFEPDLSAEDVEAAVDRIERDIRDAYPDVKHIFLEAESFKRRHAPEPDVGGRTA